jgi:hypothetical protein
MGVNHGRGDTPVTQELLDGLDVIAILEQVSGKGMPQCVAARWFHNPGLEPNLFHRPLENRFVWVVTAPFSREPVGVVV